MNADKLTAELMALADACMTLSRNIGETHMQDEPGEEWALEQKLTAAREALRAALSQALGDSQPVAPSLPPTDESMRDLVDMPIIGAVPRKYIGDDAILALQRMAASIEIVNRIACWDHMAMFELRDLIVDRAIASPQRAEPASVQAVLEFAAQHLSSDWPERCQEIVRRARAALAAHPSTDQNHSG